MSKPIIIIGSGLAGYVLAKEFRRLDNNTPLIILTRSQGYFYSKPILSNALTQGKKPEAIPMQSAEEMRQSLQADIITETTVTSIDREAHAVYLKNGKLLTYAKLVFACGAFPRSLQIKGEEKNQIFSVNTLEHYRHFIDNLQGKKHVAIIGMGLVGCEFASDLSEAGYEVDMVGIQDYPLMPKIPKETGLAIQQSLIEKGVTWHTNSEVKSIESRRSHYVLRLSQEKEVTADLVLSAIGLKSELSLAHSAGIATNQGIVVDSYLRTSDPDAYALGDCAEVQGRCFYFVAPLRLSAIALAKTLAGEKTAVNYPFMPVTVKIASCPTVFLEALTNEGSWKVVVDGKDTQSIFYDYHDQIKGFALTGRFVKERTKWLSKIS